MASSVLAKLLEVEPETLDVLARSDTARRMSLVAEALLARASDGTQKAAARARDLRRAVGLLLDPAGGLRPELLARAREAMDELEGMAHGGVGRDEFLELLDRVDLDPAWEAEAVDWARIGLLEAEGRLEDAMACLRRRFNEALASGRWTAEDEAGAILSRARSYNPGEDRIADMAGRLEAFASELGEPDPALPEELLRPHQHAKVLIVGGDERQAALAERVRGQLGKDAEAIRVTHLATGWKGNWAPILEEFERLAVSHDGVVLLRYMRTELGRSIRASLGGKPWVGCPGVGTLQVTRMVRKVAAWAAGAER